MVADLEPATRSFTVVFVPFLFSYTVFKVLLDLFIFWLLIFLVLRVKVLLTLELFECQIAVGVDRKLHPSLFVVFIQLLDLLLILLVIVEPFGSLLYRRVVLVVLRGKANKVGGF